MEIVYSSNFNDIFSNDSINTFYGDVTDLIKLGIDVEGIIYDDNWSVRRFLGFFKNKKRIKSVFNYLDIDDSLLSFKLFELSQTEFKWILLAYCLINKYKYIIFDYFDISLTYKDKKKFIKIIRKLHDDNINLIVISNDLVLLNTLNKEMYMYSAIDGLFREDMVNLINNNLIESNEIIDFINMANKKDANLEMTLDSKELLKDIYRGVR